VDLGRKDTKGMKSMRNSLFGDHESSNPVSDAVGAVTNESCCPSLSWKSRIIGFAVVAVIGLVLSVIGTLMLLTNDLITFAVCYSLGTICSLCATGFLIGPMRQLKGMFAATRVFATILLLIFIVLTLVMAFVVQIVPLVILFCILQYLAFAWYSISYIPFARTLVIKCAGRICN